MSTPTTMRVTYHLHNTPDLVTTSVVCSKGHFVHRDRYQCRRTTTLSRKDIIWLLIYFFRVQTNPNVTPTVRRTRVQSLNFFFFFISFILFFFPSYKDLTDYVDTEQWTPGVLDSLKCLQSWRDSLYYKRTCNTLLRSYFFHSLGPGFVGSKG